jgi:CelD/BcsL family acetyltransferase involved in cellulose biosynthesis
MRAPVTLRTLSSGDDFDGLKGNWDKLVQAMQRPSPFLLHGWLREWWRYYGQGNRLAVHVAERDGVLVGALPLYVRRRFGLRVAEFMGGHRSALGDLLLAEGENRSVAQELAGLTGGSDHDLADLFGLPGNSVLASSLPRGRLRLIKRVEAPVMDLSAGWEAAYNAKTSSKTRALHRRRRRQLSELGKLETSIARTPEELSVAIEDAFRVHLLRWAGRPDGSEFATATGQLFHRGAIQALAETDVPRIVSLKLDGRVIAFHYYLALCGRMYVHRLAFDPALSRFSPGLVNTLDTIETAASEGLTAVEFLGGAERYKAELSDRLDPLYQGLGLVGTPAGRVAVASRAASIAARRRLKQSGRVRKFYFEQIAPARRVAQAARRRVRG